MAINSPRWLLAELNDQRFSVSAFAAFKCALVFTGVVSRLNANKKHRQPACRAAALANRRRWQTQFAWLRHDYLPSVYSYGSAYSQTVSTENRF
jgi:hypothetical protein